ncbi:hypothetical protein EDB92DRAFT_1898192 [Lactarius akahatsu]|uniref:C3H1-type domain-containing protein n=1 Tax=Lactarius akahatsu TaxID=416441 RepID=A0AAD4L7G4_9AGAM|nr:hypothetical protein EDB92DRAFT_1898192 [Lactarius akahatsu]
MAAAWLKLEAYDIAEHCAQRALVLDPTFMKARYRRGLARKGSLQLYAATLDFELVLEQDPDCTEASKALDETLTLMNERDEDDESVAFDPEFPPLDDPTVDLRSVSDSSDWNHEGNGIPCRFYIHDSCMRGAECRFSHAPDHRSVRDRLGRNVCMYFLLGDCKFGSSACVYSHDKTYLRSGFWWDDKVRVMQLRYTSRGEMAKTNSAFLPYMCGLIDMRLAWASAHGVEMEDVYGHWWDQAQAGFRSAVEVGYYAFHYIPHESGGRGYRGRRGHGRGRGRGGMRRGGWHSDRDFEEDEERTNNFGFTEHEVLELLGHGVKP